MNFHLTVNDSCNVYLQWQKWFRLSDGISAGQWVKANRQNYSQLSSWCEHPIWTGSDRALKHLWTRRSIDFFGSRVIQTSQIRHQKVDSGVTTTALLSWRGLSSFNREVDHFPANSILIWLNLIFALGRRC